MSLRLFLLILATLSVSCGDARYLVEAELDPEHPPKAVRLAILDSTASAKIEELHNLYTQAADSLTQQFSDSLASFDAALAEQEGPIARAERRLRSARNNYAATFKGMTSFSSFGGNPIFTSSDRRVPTKELLEEIADRFYKGKAFSLETGRQIRSMIREKLIPAENRVSRASTSLSRMRNARKADEALRDKFAGQIDQAKQVLLDRYNSRIVDRLAGAVIRETSPDSAGVYSFREVPTGRFHLYISGEAPKLVEISVDGHRRIRLRGDDPSPLIEHSSSASS